MLFVPVPPPTGDFLLHQSHGKINCSVGKYCNNNNFQFGAMVVITGIW